MEIKNTKVLHNIRHIIIYSLVDFLSQIRSLIAIKTDKINYDEDQQSFLFVLSLMLDESFWKKNQFISMEKLAKHLVGLENKINPLVDGTAGNIMNKSFELLLDMPTFEARTVLLEIILNE
jgi:hypothetical protein